MFRGLFPGVRVLEVRNLSLLEVPVYLRGIQGVIHEKREALECLQYQMCNMSGEHHMLTCAEINCIFSAEHSLIL